jgi:hypothetical protein
VVTVLLITFTAATVLSGVAVYEARALRAAAQDRLAAGDTSISLATNAGTPAQFSAQAAVVRADSALTLGAGSYTAIGALASDQLTLASSTQANQQLVELAGLSGLSSHATLVAGRWPQPPGPAGASAPIPAAVPDLVATRLHLAVGTVLALRQTTDSNPVRVVIAAVYRPRNDADPYWRLSVIGTAGVQSAPPFTTYGPVAVDPSVFTAGTVAGTETRWVVQPSAAALAAHGPTASERAVNTLIARLQNASVFGGSQLDTTLPAQLAALDRARAVAQSSLEDVALALLVFAVAALAITSRPLGAQREAESYLLAVRGRSRGQALREDLAEAALLGVSAAVAAAPAGAALAAVLGRDGPLGGAAAEPGGLTAAFTQAAAWAAAAGTAALCIAVLVATAKRRQPADLREPTVRAPRLAGTARIGADLAALALTAAAYWQLRSLPLTGQGTVATVVNPLIALTPALALFATALFALRLLPPLAALCERIADRGRHLDGALTAWQISRRPRVQAGVAMLLFLSVTTATFAFSERSTWLKSISDQGSFTAGAPVRLDIQDRTAAGATAAAVSADRSVQAVTPVTQTSGGDGSIVLAMDAATAPGTVLLGAGQYSAPPDTLWNDLRADTPNIPALPSHSTRLRISATLASAEGGAVAADEAAQLSVTVEDGFGQFTELPAQPLPGDARPHTLDFPVDSTDARSVRLAEMALTYQAPTVQLPDEILTLGAATADCDAPGCGGRSKDVPLQLKSWRSAIQSTDLQRDQNYAQSGVGTSAQVPSLDKGLAGGSTSGWSQRFTPGFVLQPELAPSQTRIAVLTIDPPTEPLLPALATAGYLKSVHLGIGSITGISAGAATVSVRIVGSVATFPTMTGSGKPGGLIVDADALQYRLLDLGETPLPTTGVWLRTASGTAPAGLPDTVVSTTVAGVLTALLGDPNSEVARQGFAALGVSAGILGVAALLAAAAASRRERRGQEAVLAALGISPRRHALLHCAEGIALGTPIAAAGIAVGAALARLLLPYVILTDSATAPVPAPAVVFAWEQAALLAAAVVVIPALGAAAGALRRSDVPAMLRAMGES